MSAPATTTMTPGTTAGTNTMAVLALVFAFVFSPLGIVFGVIARKQIARTGEGGAGLAKAGIILGVIFTLLSIVYVIGMVALLSSGGGY